MKNRDFEAIRRVYYPHALEEPLYRYVGNAPTSAMIRLGTINGGRRRRIRRVSAGAGVGGLIGGARCHHGGVLGGIFGGYFGSGQTGLDSGANVGVLTGIVTESSGKCRPESAWPRGWRAPSRSMASLAPAMDTGAVSGDYAASPRASNPRSRPKPPAPAPTPINNGDVARFAVRMVIVIMYLVNPRCILIPTCNWKHFDQVGFRSSNSDWASRLSRTHSSDRMLGLT